MPRSKDSLETQSEPVSQRERPWLYPYNRRIRHLHGITIRNIALTSIRSRSKTIDDEAVPSQLKSPAKLLAQREKKLEHSRSSTDLRTVPESESDREKKAKHLAVSDGSPKGKEKRRPSFARLRRRSTMEWTHASPLERQKKLEDVAESKLADCFFSLHAHGYDEPIYVSEVAEKAMNPNFRFFDLDDCGPQITRQDGLTVKVWAKLENMIDHQYLVELNVHLPSLQFIGKSLEAFHHPLPQNCIIFHLTDGIYTSFTDLSLPTGQPFGISGARSQTTRPLLTSSYDALMRLSTLDDCIQDALATREQLTSQINEILTSNQSATSTVSSVPEAELQLSVVQDAIAIERRRLEVAQKRRDEKAASLQKRREAIEAGKSEKQRAAEQLKTAKEPLEKATSTAKNTTSLIAGQRRRICEDIHRIFPIEPIPNRPLHFTIRSLPLPNSSFDDTSIPETTIAAALGHVAQTVHLLSLYLSHPLPYPIQPRSSTSLINDPISLTRGPRTYPLFMKGAVRYRFEYAVFLLNKNIEILSNSLGIKILDLRQTLPNLKYLLYVATAGEGELPARKMGGVRGLWRVGTRPGLGSRTGSMESMGSRDGMEARKRLEDVVGTRNGVVVGASGRTVGVYGKKELGNGKVAGVGDGEDFFKAGSKGKLVPS